MYQHRCSVQMKISRAMCPVPEGGWTGRQPEETASVCEDDWYLATLMKKQLVDNDVESDTPGK